MKLNKKQMILLGVGGVGLYMWYSKQIAECPNNERAYMVDGDIVCESKLNILGYFYYSPGVDGRKAGFYHIDSWDSGFDLPREAKLEWIGAASDHILNKPVGSDFWNLGVKLLDDYFVEGSLPIFGT